MESNEAAKTASEQSTDIVINLSIDSDVQTRKGTYADLVMVRTNGGTTVFDFILNDMPADNGSARGALVSRVFMSNESVAELRDTLIRHTSGWKHVEVSPDAD